jgi:hypothetical protein
VWCGAPPEAPLALMPCCILIATVLAWASAALGAHICRARPGEADYAPVFTIFAIACALMAIAPIVPGVAAITLAAIMAAHAALIAGVLILDTLRARRRAAPTLCWSASAD